MAVMPGPRFQLKSEGRTLTAHRYSLNLDKLVAALSNRLNGATAL
jgi:hypothetical protein